MTQVRAFLLAIWEFVVGDDWRTAIGVALAIAATALIASVGISAWWVMPLAVLVLLELSIRRAARQVAPAFRRTSRGLQPRSTPPVGTEEQHQSE